MIPLRDVIPSRTTPYITVTIILINAAAWFYELAMPREELNVFLQLFGVVPAAFVPTTLLTSMFLHGGWSHVIGNMWYLWIFGDNIEDRLGHLRYLIFYLATGLIASASELFAAPQSAIPMLGASGAVAGVLGAYLWWYPRARVQTLVPIFIFLQFMELPAVLFLGLWFVMQILGSLGGEGGVAWYAHIFGFLGGLLLSMLATRPPPRPVRPLPVSRNIYRRR